MTIEYIMDLADAYAKACLDYATSQTCDSARYKRQEDLQDSTRYDLEIAIQKYRAQL